VVGAGELELGEQLRNSSRASSDLIVASGRLVQPQLAAISL
jgi:hypothetical protein